MAKKLETTEEAIDLKAAIEQDRQRRIEAAKRDIQELCQRHRVGIVPVVELRGGEVIGRLELVATE